MNDLGAVGIRISGQPTWELMRSIVCLKSPHGFKYITVGEQRRFADIDVAANELVQDFLSDGNLEWILFVDDDAVVHPLTLTRLLSWNQPIVSALAFTRRVPIAPVVFGTIKVNDGYPIEFQDTMHWLARYPELLTQSATILHEAPEDALYQVGFTGLHCTLIRREVFEKMNRPYFVKTGKMGQGEDTYFCEHARALGYKIYVDRSVISGHIGLHEFAGLDFQAWALWMQQREEYLRKNAD